MALGSVPAAGEPGKEAKEKERFQKKVNIFSNIMMLVVGHQCCECVTQQPGFGRAGAV